MQSLQRSVHVSPTNLVVVVPTVPTLYANNRATLQHQYVCLLVPVVHGNDLWKRCELASCIVIESWTLLASDTNSLESFHMKSQMHILRNRCYDRIRNTEITERTGLSPLMNLIIRRRNSLFGHVARATIQRKPCDPSLSRFTTINSIFVGPTDNRQTTAYHDNSETLQCICYVRQKIDQNTRFIVENRVARFYGPQYIYTVSRKIVHFFL